MTLPGAWPPRRWEEAWDEIVPGKVWRPKDPNDQQAITPQACYEDTLEVKELRCSVIRLLTEPGALLHNTPRYWIPLVRIADVNTLRELAAHLESGIEQYSEKWQALVGLPQDAYITPRLWSQSVPVSQASSTTGTPGEARSPAKLPPPRPVPRPSGARERCLRRDGNKCLVTQCEVPGSLQALHIIPGSLLRVECPHTNNAWVKVWRCLGTFFPKDVIEKWRKCLRDALAQTNSTANYMTTRSDVHAAYNRGELVFKPVPSPTGEPSSPTEIFVQAHWLPPADDPVDEPFAETPSSRGQSGPQRRDKERPNHCIEYTSKESTVGGCWDTRAVRTGDVFRWATDDPIVRALPSEDLIHFAAVLAFLVRHIWRAHGRDYDFYADDEDPFNGVAVDDCRDRDTSSLLVRASDVLEDYKQQQKQQEGLPRDDSNNTLLSGFDGNPGGSTAPTSVSDNASPRQSPQAVQGEPGITEHSHATLGFTEELSLTANDQAISGQWSRMNVEPADATPIPISPTTAEQKPSTLEQVWDGLFHRQETVSPNGSAAAAGNRPANEKSLNKY